MRGIYIYIEKEVQNEKLLYEITHAIFYHYDEYSDIYSGIWGIYYVFYAGEKGCCIFFESLLNE